MYVKFINAITGTEMWVTDKRVEEYKSAGHKLALLDNTEEPVKEEPGEAETKSAPKKTTTKKTATKRK